MAGTVSMEFLIECSVCFHQYDTEEHMPKYLECHHCLCIACIELMKIDLQVTCPMCRHVSNLGDHNIHLSLRTNEDILVIKEMLMQNEKPTLNRAVWSTDFNGVTNRDCTFNGNCMVDIPDVLPNPLGEKILLLDICRRNWMAVCSERTNLQSLGMLMETSLLRLYNSLNRIMADNAVKLLEARRELESLDQIVQENRVEEVNSDKLNRMSEDETAAAEEIVQKFDRMFGSRLTLLRTLSVPDGVETKLNGEIPFFDETIDGLNDGFNSSDAKRLVGLMLAIFQTTDSASFTDPFDSDLSFAHSLNDTNSMLQAISRSQAIGPNNLPPPPPPPVKCQESSYSEPVLDYGNSSSGIVPNEYRPNPARTLVPPSFETPVVRSPPALPQRPPQHSPGAQRGDPPSTLEASPEFRLVNNGSPPIAPLPNIRTALRPPAPEKQITSSQAVPPRSPKDNVLLLSLIGSTGPINSPLPVVSTTSTPTFLHEGVGYNANSSQPVAPTPPDRQPRQAPHGHTPLSPLIRKNGELTADTLQPLPSPTPSRRLELPSPFESALSTRVLFNGGNNADLNVLQLPTPPDRQLPTLPLVPPIPMPRNKSKGSQEHGIEAMASIPPLPGLRDLLQSPGTEQVDNVYDNDYEITARHISVALQSTPASATSSNEQKSACAWSPVSLFMASTHLDGHITHVEMVRREKQSEFKSVRKRLYHMEDPACQVTWSPDGLSLATGSEKGVIRLWDRGGEALATKKQHENQVRVLRWNRRSNLLASGGQDKKIIVWDKHAKANVWQHVDPDGPITNLDWLSSDAFTYVSITSKIYLYKLNTPNPVVTWTDHKEPVTCIKWDGNGEFMASCSADRSVKIWTKYTTLPLQTYQGHKGTVNVVRWSPPKAKTNRLLASCSDDGTALLWDVEYGKIFCSMDGKKMRAFTALAYSPNGKLIATGDKDGVVQIWSIKNGCCIETYTYAKTAIDYLDWSFNSQWLGISVSNVGNMIIDIRKKRS